MIRKTNQKMKNIALTCCIVSIVFVGCTNSGSLAKDILQPVESDNPPTLNESVPANDSKSFTEITGETKTANTKQVGKDEYGYILIPNSWTNFRDLSPAPGIIQFTDGAGAIISMNRFDASLNIDIQTALSNLAALHESQGAENMTNATVQLNGRTVSQIHG